MVNTKQLITEVDFPHPYELIQDTIEYILKLSKGFEAQINATLNQDGTTRFANNQITQHTDIHSLTLDVKLGKGKNVASGFTTTITHSYLDHFVKDIMKSVENSPEISF